MTSSRRVFYIVVGVLILVSLLGVLTAFYGEKLLVSKSNSIVSLRLNNQKLNQEQANLASAKQDVTKYTPLNNIAETIVPQDKNQAQAVLEITNFATRSGIDISSITFPVSNLGTGSSGGKGAIASPPSQLEPVIGISGIYVLPITVQSDTNHPITYKQLISFLQLLENNRHTAEVSQLSITPSSSNTLSFNIVINVYIKK